MGPFFFAMSILPSQVRVGAVVVVYYPDPEKIIRLLDALRSLPHVVVIKNDGPEINNKFWSSQVLQRCNIKIVQMNENKGIARAINSGVNYLISCNSNFIWTFDQDSRPQEGALAQMLEFNRQAVRQGNKKIAAIVPIIFDVATNTQLKYLVQKNNRKITLSEKTGSSEIICAITSGMLIPVSAWKKIGPMNESFFIDYVDTEWCFRARAQGYKILVSAESILEHCLGDTSQIDFFQFTINLKKRVPMRTYHILRNGWRLTSMSCAPKGWRLYFNFESLRIIVKAILLGPDRSGQIKAISKAWFDSR